MSQNPDAEANRRHWDDRTEVHMTSDYYDIDRVMRCGPQRIAGPDEDEVGDVRGKRLLHLYCHIGTDSLRWTALGADVTGVDISDASIEAASNLARGTGLSARFIRSDVFELPSRLAETFDIVYASYGVLCWIPDIDEWARIASSFVRPGGFLYLSDGHPIDVALEPSRYQRHGYFDTGRRRYEDAVSYTDGRSLQVRENYRWHHTLANVVTAIVASGLRLEYLHENAFGSRQRDPKMIEDSRGRWHNPGDPVPLGFSLKATKAFP